MNRLTTRSGLNQQKFGRSQRTVPTSPAVVRDWALSDRRHAVTRQGDEMACKCGKRWPAGEDHP